MSEDGFRPVARPDPIFEPPLNITRVSQYVLSVKDLDVSLRFYQGVIGLLLPETPWGLPTMSSWFEEGTDF